MMSDKSDSMEGIEKIIQLKAQALDSIAHKDLFKTLSIYAQIINEYEILYERLQDEFIALTQEMGNRGGESQT